MLCNALKHVQNGGVISVFFLGRGQRFVTRQLTLVLMLAINNVLAVNIFRECRLEIELNTGLGQMHVYYDFFRIFTI